MHTVDESRTGDETTGARRDARRDETRVTRRPRPATGERRARGLTLDSPRTAAHNMYMYMYMYMYM